MPTQRNIPYNWGVFSITFTCFRWLPLIRLTGAYDLVYLWFDILKAKGHYILGYVIMPNHVHVLIAFCRADTSINTIMGNGKRFMAYTMVNRLKEMHANEILAQLSAGVESKGRARNKLHAVWEFSFDWKYCTTIAFMKQKLDYYHRNPLSGKWKLAHAPESYLHSSAQSYVSGILAHYPATNYLEVKDMYF